MKIYENCVEEYVKERVANVHAHELNYVETVYAMVHRIRKLISTEVRKRGNQWKNFAASDAAIEELMKSTNEPFVQFLLNEFDFLYNLYDLAKRADFVTSKKSKVFFTVGGQAISNPRHTITIKGTIAI